MQGECVVRRWALAFAGAAALSLAACQGELSGANSGASGASAVGGASASGGAAANVGPGNSQTASASVARRLTRTELTNTLRDVLGDTEQTPAKFLPEDEYRPFDNDYSVQRASRALIESLEALAEDVAASALAPSQRDKLVPCVPAGAGDTACLRQTIESLGLRLYRRPLSEEQITAYLGLQAFATEDNPYVENDFYTAVNLVLRSMLQDPEVLYRIEVGTPAGEPGIAKLDSYDLASRLSFLLWGSAPDAALLEAAAADNLVEGTARAAQAARLLADPRARAQIERFHAMWLGYRAIPASAELASAFNLETSKLIQRVVFDEPSSYLELFTSSQTYANALLAGHYGLPAPAGGEGWVSYADGQRAGILSHGSVLAGFSKFSDTSPTQRGIFVQSRLLCNPIAPPPPDVNVDEPPSGAEATCKLDRYDEHRKLASCAGCHANLDPIGYGLESYDIAGRFRTHDDGNPECMLPNAGELPGYGSFSGPGELAQLLVSSGELEQCFVQHFMSYAIGRELRAEEEGARDALLADFKSGGYALTELLTSFVSDERFALRQEEAVP